MKAVQATFYLAGALLLTGCASTVYEGKYDWREGWRKAEVVAVQTAAEMERPRFFSCVRHASPEQLATARFAVVKYREMSRTQRRAIPVGADDKVVPGNLVYVKAGDCSTPLVHIGPEREPADPAL